MLDFFKQFFERKPKVEKVYFPYKAQEEGAMTALEHCLNAPSCGE